MFCMFINIGCVVTGESKLRIVCELTECTLVKGSKLGSIYLLLDAA